ncbi:hypothetical protein GFS31_38600 [Leptolyngbya sp. BL0902]|uniref:hypothetical protein n=1 Tax=Leptolyngbya sp. BL0902 TaxID=1115757 RepID=UPI0018E7269C|nr:hypothetical protein [Leptolyngbya sp. BL0902]QQE67148.1 hypothetical protein GFS31_38600 [Leptolyngbya sp. BL0902]
MRQTRWLKGLIPLALGLLLMVNACASAPSRYDQVQQDTTGFGAPSAVDRGAEQGSTFNQFFPNSQGDYQVIPYQEKKGFAEYKLQRGDQTLAMLSISDTISLPAAAEKYNDATDTVAGFPAMNQGSTGTGLLVNGRYQVKVLSRDAAFTEANRVEWLQRFDLQGLAQLKSAIKPSTKAAKAPAAPATPTSPLLPPAARSPELVPVPAS